MTLAYQPSLMDCAPTPQLTDLSSIRRTELSRGAWIDHLPNWLIGGDPVLDALVHQVPWRAEQRQMYDSIVDVPRLVHGYGVGHELPHPCLTEARDQLSAHYAQELREPFVTGGCCFYRDGKDSVAWHGDNLGRGRTQDTMVAIMSFGSSRKLLLRPLGGTTEVSLTLSQGDLVVMGGSCQRTWQHAVPKTSQPVGPRISVQFRPLNVL